MKNVWSASEKEHQVAANVNIIIIMALRSRTHVSHLVEMILITLIAKPSSASPAMTPVGQ